MYKQIFVPVDNSDHSNRAIDTAITLGKAFESQMTGCHVYAAKLHDYRFKQMEYTLPEEYLDEPELDRQRKIHDSLITLGLELISDSYLERMKGLCVESQLPFEPKMMDGKHHAALIEDIGQSDYDLVVIGALGVGRVKDSQIGSVCERVSRACDRDVLVIKHVPKPEEDQRDTILVGVDGSPQSFGALVTAIELAQRCNKKIELISVYDPYLHYAVFNGIVDCLTERAAKVFRFEEQNQLHEEIIDTGLAQIYQSHLDVAQNMAETRGVEVKKTLLDGKAFQKILDHARETKPWLLVVGRIGVHANEGEHGLGSNSENLLRACDCDLLLTTRLEHPSLDLKAEESIRWSREAEERMERVPPMVKGIARTAILRLAVEKGHSVITSSVIEEAMERFMPGYTSDATRALAGQLALERANNQPISMCRKCGVTAKDASPVRCAVCDGTEFDQVTKEMLERIAEIEGGVMEEATFDGKKLMWSKEAKTALRAINDLYKRRRTKARIEKSARAGRIPTITLDFCKKVIEEETGTPLSELMESAEELNGTAGIEELKIIARDAQGTPLQSSYDWTPEAAERVIQVPSGFMRQRTQERIERIAWERDANVIDMEIVDLGLEVGRQMMAELMKNYVPNGTLSDITGTEAKCPFSGASMEAPTATVSNGNGNGASNGNGHTVEAKSNDDSNGNGHAAEANGNGQAMEGDISKCPAHQLWEADEKTGESKFSLNEISALTEMMAKQRGGLRGKD